MLEEHGRSLNSFGIEDLVGSNDEILHELELWGSDLDSLAANTLEAYHLFTMEQRTVVCKNNARCRIFGSAAQIFFTEPRQHIPKT